jgi:hypothetical protein
MLQWYVAEKRHRARGTRVFPSFESAVDFSAHSLMFPKKRRTATNIVRRHLVQRKAEDAGGGRGQREKQGGGGGEKARAGEDTSTWHFTHDRRTYGQLQPVKLSEEQNAALLRGVRCPILTIVDTHGMWARRVREDTVSGPGNDPRSSAPPSCQYQTHSRCSSSSSSSSLTEAEAEAEAEAVAAEAAEAALDVAFEHARQQRRACIRTSITERDVARGGHHLHSDRPEQSCALVLEWMAGIGIDVGVHASGDGGSYVVGGGVRGEARL